MMQFCAGYIPTLFNANSVKMYGPEYGSLTRGWDHCLSLHGAILGFSRAFATFKAQQQITSTLRELVDAIVDEANPSGNAKWTALVRSGFRGSGCEALWGS